jgi:hypothetical protein
MKSLLQKNKHIRAMIVGVALIVLTNAIVLGGVAYNRSGEPDSTITLTERELALPYRYRRNDENSGIHLRISYRKNISRFDGRAYWYGQEPAWLDDKKLSALGFDMSRSIAPGKDSYFYQRRRVREVILVLEYEGAAYQEELKRTQEKIAELESEFSESQGNKRTGNELNRVNTKLQREKESASRLFVIDAGLDSNQLRKEYTDRTKYLLINGLVGVRVKDSGTSHPSLIGFIQSLSNETIHVPLPHYNFLETVMAEDSKNRSQNNPPRYKATINIGQRLEPWLVDVAGIDD